MTALILNQMLFTVLLIVALAVGVNLYDSIKKIHRRWGFHGIKPRYAMAFVARRVLP